MESRFEKLTTKTESMAKRPKSFLWDPRLPWEVNLQAIVDAQAAKRRVWSAARKRNHATALRKARRRRKREAFKRVLARHKLEHGRGPRPLVGRRLCDTVARAMEPGVWYGWPDLLRLTGMPRDSLSGIINQKMLFYGLLERARNSEARGRYRRPGDTAPRVLFRLSPKGVELRGLLALLE